VSNGVRSAVETSAHTDNGIFVHLLELAWVIPNARTSALLSIDSFAIPIDCLQQQTKTEECIDCISYNIYRGTCIDGKCECDVGYTGLICDTKVTEHQVLRELYEATNGLEWTDQEGWVDDSIRTHCQWKGIRCNSAGSVVEISLSGNDLRGSIPKNIAMLSMLTDLDLSSNNCEPTRWKISSRFSPFFFFFLQS
jgi:hypothetical protein